MEKLRLALISGGVSSEREVSLKSGDQVYAALDKTRYDIRRYDPQSDLPQLVRDAGQLDAALIILHGPFGEDGTVQGLLDLLQIPYQGSGVLGSAVAMNKLISKRLYEKAGIPVPAYVVIGCGDASSAGSAVARLGLPLVVKPVSAGSSIGMSIVREAQQLEAALGKAFVHDGTVMVEKFIDGTELTAGVIGNAELEALPLIEIVPQAGYDFFDYEAKYKPGATNEICPARIDAQLTAKVQEYAKMAHRALFCDGYSRTDMILVKDETYVLETNTIPGMTETSLLPQAAKVAGMPFGPLMDRLIQLGVELRRRS